MVSDCEMGMDQTASVSSCDSFPTFRRLTLTPTRLRIKEERKRIMRALDAKYRTIDCESNTRRFVLIKNNLRRLERESREEKLSRHRSATAAAASRASNLSPSCLSATRPRSPSPPPSMGLESPPKRLRLCPCDDDKENETTNDSSGADVKMAWPLRTSVDDAQEILRDLFETCGNESVTPRPDSPIASSPFPDGSNSQTTTYSLSMSASCSLASPSFNTYNNSCNNAFNNTINSTNDSDWHKPSQYPLNCGQSSLLGNDLQSLVFHSLITSLES